MLDSQGAPGSAEGGGGDAQSGQAASTALIEKILSEEPRWQGKSALYCFERRSILSFANKCSERGIEMLLRYQGNMKALF